MRKVTGIGKGNEAYFEPLLMGTAAGEDILRFGVIEDGAAAGVMAVAASDGRADILWIYVLEEYRRRGIAREMLETFLDEAQDQESFVGVSAVYPHSEAMDTLLTSEGFLVIPGEPICMIDTADALNSERLQNILSTKIAPSVESLEELGLMERKQLQNLLLHGRIQGQDLQILGYDQQLSAVVTEEEGGPEAVLLAGRDHERCLLQFLYNSRSDEPDNLLQLVRYLTQAIQGDESLKQLCFSPESAHIRRFAEKLVSDPELIREEVLTRVASLAF